ncbi:MAG TPA: AraC family transcriptional regulator [Limnohabitans sp.]|jgi:AraC-like DNA-binding protein|uniref:AraC family transcriptional regulator n=1 Tax=Limnohabitans sp. TaxID=1907725 RepID=UPI00269B56DB|nr:AraC family transcriptional regulator [Limnohabitans sp.]HQR86685.1 AraC family transcriptional regulator [Limnohabitans sp.]HQS27898.1 AraC family transcriptional regulator [Limnohabitans sp.]
MVSPSPTTETAPALGRAETPIAFIQAIAAAYEQRGLRVDDALKQAQIEPKLIKKNNARVTAMQMELISGLAMQELDDEGLGWFSRRLPWGSYGMLVRASLTSPTLGLALARWCRHHGLLTDDIQLSLTERNGVATLQLDEARYLGVFREFCVVSVLRNALGVACWLTDSRIPLTATHLRFAPPAHADSYHVLFDGPTHFNATANCLQFDAGYLALPVRRDEAALQQMLQRALLLTVRPYRRDRLLVEKVRQTLAQHPEHSRNAEDLAAWLNMSPRTLHRQLQEEGASLQQLKDSVREQRARALLLRTNKPLKQIAAEVGFSNEKSFIRAFKSWTGQAPEAFRQSA